MTPPLLTMLSAEPEIQYVAWSRVLTLWWGEICAKKKKKYIGNKDIGKKYGGKGRAGKKAWGVEEFGR